MRLGGGTFTFGPNVTVRGRGMIEQAFTLFNQGTIHADVNSEPLELRTNQISNSGVLRSTNGGERSG